MLKLFKIPELRRKIGFSLGVIVLFRFLAHIPVPGIDVSAIKSYLESNALLSIFNLFSGGAFENFSIATLGVGPYINASIIVQLFTVMIPSWEELSKEGEYGRDKLNLYTKLFTIPIAFLQAYGIYYLLSQQGVITSLNMFNLLVLILTLVGGTMLLMWIGDLVTEYGLGNGISIIIFVGIVSRLVPSIFQIISAAQFGALSLLSVLPFLALTLLVVVGVVLVNEGTRNILIEYGRRSTRSQTVTNYLPIKINQAGVIPIIFAVAVISIPSLLSGPLIASSNAFLQGLGNFLATYFLPNSLPYNILYFVLVFGFTFFYSSVQFDPVKVADDIKKRGGFIPGIRPGNSTASYLKTILVRITFIGALFLGLVAVLPFILQSLFPLGGLVIGGTSLLIAVSVILETVRQAQSLMAVRDYQSYLR